MGKLVEGLWDCSYCGTKGIGGSIRDCPNCGRPRDETTQFYLPNSINYVSEEKATTINRNPDWICPYCNSLNSDSHQSCPSCGSVRTSENDNYFTIKEQNKKEKETYSPSSKVRNKNLQIMNGYSRNSYNNKVSNKFNWKLVSIIFIILSLIIGIIYLFIPKNEELTITSFQWERCIRTEEYVPVTESDWYLPKDGKLLYSNSEIHHYEKVIDHYETKTRQVAKERLVGYDEYVSGYKDLGNGYFEELTSQKPIYETYYKNEYYQEPVYVQKPIFQTKYYYEINKWLYKRSVNTSGSDKNPYWGNLILSDNERISSETEHYFVTGTNKKGKTKQVSINYENWLVLEINETVKLKVSIFGKGKFME